jgi:uncharacterized protein (DUF302 family)
VSSLRRIPLVVAAMLGLAPALPVQAADDIGIFETILESSGTFDETTAALEAALAASPLQLHAKHDVRVPEDAHKARVYVLTAPDYVAAAANEPARTISAQILRLAVYTSGDAQTTFVNMANPVAHALVFYADSVNDDILLEAAGKTAEQIRTLVSGLPGKPLSEQAEPRRSEKRYRNFNGDGPARMMARFRRWEKSQLEIFDDSAANFEAVVNRVIARINERPVADASESTGWELVSQIRLRDDVVHLGLANPYVEDKMIGINSRFRDAGKSEASPYPGVDHMAALPIEVLIVKEGDRTVVRHYGQMWRMQLYFWDSGYRAFTANVGVPDNIVDSIEDTVSADR